MSNFRWVWFQLFDSGSGHPFKGATATTVSVSTTTIVDHFRDAVKAKYADEPKFLKDIPSSILLVYKDKSSFDNRNFGRWTGTSVEIFLSSGWSWTKRRRSPRCRCAIKRPKCCSPQNFSCGYFSFDSLTEQGKILEYDRKTYWEISTLPQLQYVSASPLFQLNSDYLAKTGLPTQNLILYCRPTFHEQFKFLRQRVINENVLGWVLGPPGTGKSTTALAFASTLERNEWVISWIHLDRHIFPVYVRLEGDCKKYRHIIGASIHELHEILQEVDNSKKHIVFVDGYALEGPMHIEVQQACYFWLDQDRENRRLVIICSMSSRYKSKPEKDMLLKVETFFVYSWKEDEYLSAVGHPEFFENVKSVLDIDLSSKRIPSPQDLVLSKLYFAGASARWMFFFPTKTIVEQTNEALAAVDDIIPYIKGKIGDKSNHVVNRLLSSSFFPRDMCHRKVSIVSRFAGVMLAIIAGPSLIRPLAEATRHDGNPSMDGWMLEMWFLASLRHNGVKLLDYKHKEVHRWPEANVETLDVTSFPTLPESKGVWFKPSKWNQGGFDAVYMDKRKGLVRFVQVIGADAHSFKIEYVYIFLNMLSCSKESFDITSLEIFFVVDWKKRSQFTLAEPTGKGLLEPFGWKKGKENEHVKILYISGWTDE